MVVFSAFFVLALAWSVYTRHVWEDFYITYRASKNLATGQGLTYTAGEHVHSFTSPLGTLLPALASLLTANRSDAAALWIYRLMCIAAYAGAGTILWRLGRGLFATFYPALLLVLLCGTDAKMIDFSTNGMETAFMLLFMAWTFQAMFLSTPQRPRQLGLAWAGLMWTRPDSFVYIGALALGMLLFKPFTPRWGARGALLKDFLIAGAITTAVYLPWVLWAWSYYGSPVPHTVIAKGLPLPPVNLKWLGLWLLDFPGRLIKTGANLATVFMPHYCQTTGWPSWALRISAWVAAVVLGLWLLPFVRWEAKAASFAFTVGIFFLNYFASFPYPWYIPTVTLLAFVALMIVFGQIADRLAGPRPGAGGPGAARRTRTALLAAAVLAAAAPAVLAGLVARQMRLFQRICENENRLPMAEWLRDHATAPKDTVFLEPLGYVGYFSNLKMYDFPGLASPEVVALRRKSRTSGDYVAYFPELISALEPDWLVLRKGEADQVRQFDRDLLARFYRLEKTFNVRDRIMAIPFVPGRGYLLFDSHYEVYHRHRETDEPEAALRQHLRLRLLPIGVDSLIARDTWAGPAYDSNGYIAAHAPSRLTVRVPPRTHSIAGRFGFFPGSYETPNQQTHGADFTVSLIGADGSRTQVFQATLTPSERVRDRGDQAFSLDVHVTGEGTLAEFAINPRPGKNNAFCWTYWTGLKFWLPQN